MVIEQVEGGEHIAGDREKALDLTGPWEIEGDVTVGAGHLDHVCDEAG